MNIQQLLKEGNLRQAITALEAIQPNLPGLSGLKQEYNDMQEQLMQERETWEAYRSAEQKLAGKLSKLVDGLATSLVGEIKPQPQIDRPVLVIAHHERRIPELEGFFRVFGFSQVQVSTWNTRPGFDRFKVIVFDNSDLMDETEAEESMLKMDQRKKRQEREDQMEYCLQESTSYFLHYGNQLKWVNGHRARVQAANSKFTLYARLKELVDFMRAYRLD